MYYRHNNKTAIRSQNMISEALFRLMKKKDFSQISVTELCAEAAVGRKTFYRNFELREDVIDFRLDLMFEEYRRELKTISPEEYLYHHFSYIQKNAEDLITLYRNGLISMAITKFSALMSETMPIWSEDPIEQEYRSAYVAAGIEAIQRIWVSRGFAESIEEVVGLL